MQDIYASVPHACTIWFTPIYTYIYATRTYTYPVACMQLQRDATTGVNCVYGMHATCSFLTFIPRYVGYVYVVRTRESVNVQIPALTPVQG
jgi:hypothetical protein